MLSTSFSLVCMSVSRRVRDTGSYCRAPNAVRSSSLEEIKNEVLSQPARLAQSVEHGTLNPRVVGSSPTSGDFFLLFFLPKALPILINGDTGSTGSLIHTGRVLYKTLFDFSHTTTSCMQVRNEYKMNGMLCVGRTLSMV